MYKREKGRKSKIRIGFKSILSLKRNDSKIKRLKNKKGKFILATNVLDENRLPSKKILNIYKGRTGNIEGCFKTIKDSQYRLNEIFLKRVDRVETLMSVISLILFINNLCQFTLRKNLKEKNKSISSQVGKEITNPTFKWAMHLLNKIIKVKINISGGNFEKYHGIKDAQKKSLNVLESKLIQFMDLLKINQFNFY